ncbi:MAG: hotdog domain-containing protein [Nanobdellota archaeon]
MFNACFSNCKLLNIINKACCGGEILTALYKIQTKHLNEYSTLYGGQLLEWIDNYCLAKTQDYKKRAGEEFVTRSINCDFLKPVYLGDLLRIRISNEKLGNTSITFDYEVLANDIIAAKGSTTFVKLFEKQKSPIK